MSEQLQRSMLTEPVAPDDVEVAVRYLPASQAAQVGGDWYDAFAQADGATVLVVGDVVGHDSVAAAVMGQLAQHPARASRRQRRRSRRPAA